MPITTEQRIARRARIGSSDSPAVAGVDPWRSRADVYLEKTQEVEELNPTEAIEIGNTMERPLIEWAAAQLGIEVRHGVSLQARDGILAANLDALAVSTPQGIEAKTTSNPDEYGDEGSDQVPDRCIVQVQHQMYVADLEVVWVPVLLARRDRLQRVMYRVPRNEKLIALVVEQDHRFWNEHVIPRVPPEGFLPSMDLLKRVRRVPEKIATVDTALVADYEAQRAARILAEDEEDRLKVRLLTAMGDAEGADFGDPRWLYTYLESSRTTVDGRLLKARFPEIWNEFQKTSTYRTLRRVNRK